MNRIEQAVSRHEKEPHSLDDRQSSEPVSDTRVNGGKSTEPAQEESPRKSKLQQGLAKLVPSSWQRIAPPPGVREQVDPDMQNVSKENDEESRRPEGTSPSSKIPMKNGQKIDLDEPDFVPPASLQKRYLVSGTKYYFRHQPRILAFEDKGKRLTTSHDDTEIAKSMIQLAQAKGWQVIRIKGSDTFKQEAWLAAALKGIDVQGYKPSAFDLARLADMRLEMDAGTHNIVEKGLERDLASSEHDERESAPHKYSKRNRDQEATPQLSPQQQIAVNALKEILHQRGDSELAIKMAEDFAKEKFRSKPIHYGQLLEHGKAPFEFDQEKNESYFVHLKTQHGERYLWGLDFDRAIYESGAKLGDPVALEYLGSKLVTIRVREIGPDRKPTGKWIDFIAKRNSWNVEVTDPPHERSGSPGSARTRQREPVVNVYDKSAPRETGREPMMPGDATIKRDPQQQVQR